MRFLAEHTLLLRITAALLAVILGLSIAWIGMRSRPAGYQPQHFSPLEAETSPWYTPRHTPEYHAQREQSHGRHAATEPGPGATLGRAPDGDLQLVDDEPTRELVGTAA